MSRLRRGFLAAILVIVPLILLGGFALAASAMFNLTLTQKVSNEQIAQDLADSVIQEAIANLMDDQSYGSSGGIEIRLPQTPGVLPEGAEGVLTFKANNPAGIPYSSNNFGGAHKDGWGGRKVPLQNVLLIGQGKCGGQTRTVEMMVHLPKYPKAMASEGDITATNTLVGAVKDPSKVTFSPAGEPIISEDNLDRGDLLSNRGVQILTRSRVTGSAQASLDVSVDGSSRIDGEVLSRYDAAALPNITITDYDPAKDPDTSFDEITDLHPLASVSLAGVCRYKTGDVHLGGDATLDNAVVYVNGNLIVDGAINGRGSVICTGNLTLHGSAVLRADDSVAVLAQGDVRLSGNPGATSVFAGLVYTRGSFVANQVTILGGFISDKPVGGGAPGHVVLSDCSLLQSSFFATSRFAHPWSAVVARFGPKAGAATVTTNALKYKVGNPAADSPVVGRTVDNVIGATAHSDPERWCSNWAVSDPAVILIRRVGLSTLEYSYSLWGRNAGKPGNATAEPAALVRTTDRATFVQAIVASEASANAQGYLDPVPLDATLMTNNLNQLLDALNPEESLNADAFLNFKLEPNQFLKDSDKIRCLYRRVL